MSNKKFLCVMRAPNDAKENSSSQEPSPAQMQEMYAKFSAWKEKFSENLDDLGGKLGDGKVVTTEAVKDGPFAEMKEVAGGYMIVTAPDIQTAVQVAQESPGVFPGSSVEVREIVTS